MASILVFVILSCIFLVRADDCDCKQDKSIQEAEEMIKFLRHLPSHLDKEQRYPVVPGELAPLVPCANCIAKNRRKRTVRGIPGHGCPVDFIRLGRICVNGRRFGVVRY
ncbi:unnamed protein product [Leptosia nina]|uniref:Secreted protein n=1 Tax=Leptosia nina TaxID=320188 RepID=A0AAV1JBP7_9NEOP